MLIGMRAGGNTPGQLKHMQADLKKLLKNLYKKKRVAASHILVIMVSSEQRHLKPYALPVQFIPYKSLRDQHIRDLVQKLKETMVQLGLVVAGQFVIENIV